MLNLKDERKILNIIKFSPIIFVLFISFFSTQIYLFQREKEFNKEIELTKQKYLIDNKKKVKEEIERISKFIIIEKNRAEELLKQEIKNKIYEAHTIAMNIYESEKNNHTKEELFLIIKSTLKSMSFDNQKEYFFISDKKGKVLFTNFDKEFKNKVLVDEKDKNTLEFVKEFEPFNIIIGLRKYIDTFEINLQKELLLRVKSLENNDDSYIFIFDEKGLVLGHYKNSLLGTNRFNVKNPLGKYVVKDIIEFALKNKEGFISYKTGVNPNNLKDREKISYVKLIQKWNWIIGTGFFIEEFNKEIEEKTKYLLESRNESINKIFLFSIVITLIFILISFYLSKNIAKRFYEYRNTIKDEINKTIEKEKLLIQQSKMATMGEMIGNIAHQWKQPLSIISISNGYLKLQKEFGTLTDEDFYKSLSTIDNSVKNLNSTINDFSNFFNPNKKNEYFYLDNTFEKTLKLINSQFKNNNIQIIKDIESIEMYGLENELLQTLINILKNAKDELIKKEEDEKRLIFINVYEKKQKVIIKIKDNAGGIPEKLISKIFDPYFTTKKDDEGTGIGLYMSKQIIEGMNGLIEVKNTIYTYNKTEYTGAEFKIEIPN